MSPVCHVAVLAFPFGTHAAPLLILVNRLAASAPDTIFSFFTTSSSIAAIFSPTNNTGSNITPYAVPDGLPEGYVFSGNPLLPIEYFLKAAPDNFDKSIKVAEDKSRVKISCLLTDAFLWFAADFAEKIDVPWIPLWTAAPCSLLIHAYTDDIRNKFGGTNAAKAGKDLDFIPGLSAITMNDLPEEVLLEDSKSIFASTLHKMALNLPKATAVVLNCFEEIDPIITNHLKSTIQLNILNIGPLQPSSSSIPPTDNECLKWLQTQHHNTKVIYISFGTVINPPPLEMVALASTLESQKISFLWSLRDEARKHLPEDFVDRTSAFGKIVSWAPQFHVLQNPAVGVFVTHCGWNSVLESISCGVPVIGRPFFADQKVNSRMVEDVWRIGVKVEGGVFTEETTVGALELVLFSDKGKEMRENVGRLKEKASDAIKANGSSTRNFESLLAAFNRTAT